MSDALRTCAECGAASAPGAAACWLCESALRDPSPEPARGPEPELASWAVSIAAALCTAVLACVELARLDAVRAVVALCVVVPAFATLGAMAAARRGGVAVRGAHALPSGVWRGALGLVSIGLGLLFVAVVVGLYSARFAP